MDETTSLGQWPPASTMHSPRLVLDPLVVEHATELAPLLDDPRLHEFTGGSPATADSLRVRFQIKTRGYSADGSERWLNWVVRSAGETGSPVGLVQATITATSGEFQAAVAWVIATEFQGKGYAKEAAATVVDWLCRQAPVRLIAYIHPGHTASSSVAAAVGLHPTTERVDGEVVWVRDPTPQAR